MSIKPEIRNYQHDDDEIDLFELWNRLWQQKILIFFITGLFLLVGIVYSYTIEPIYKSSAYLLPPLTQNVKALQLNIKRSPFFDTDINDDNQETKSIAALKKEVLENFFTNFQSRQLQRNFFDEYVFSSLKKQKDENIDRLFVEKFHEELSISIPSDSSIGAPYIISLNSNDPELGAKFVNEYIKLAIAQSKEQIVSDIQATIDAKKTELNLMLDSMREAAEQKKSDRLEYLKEALTLAESIGLHQIQEAQSPVPTMQYLRGSEAIQSEIKVLQQRESEDSFITGLRDVERYLSYLNNINVGPEDFKVVRVDQYATVPDKPINSKIFIVLGMSLLGVIVGMFIALIKSTINARKQKIVS